MTISDTHQFTFGKVGSQEVKVDFTGGRIVSDAGLLALRAFDHHLGIVAGLAQLLHDPRQPLFIIHSKEALLTQTVYQILAGYPDGNDADSLRHDPLFKTLLGQPAEDDSPPLASSSTLNRFLYAYTRRDAQFPLLERPVLAEQQTALNQRLVQGNDYLLDLFIRTRRAKPSFIILDVDATDDPTHGQQVLSGYHGYFGQHQYFPLYVYDGATGFPLAAWLRPGTVHGSYGAVDTLQAIVAKLRQAWPSVLIMVRADNGFAVPEMYEFCEREGLLYALGYASNDVLKARTETVLWQLQTYYHWYGNREPHVQRFESIEDYQADSWTRPRRIIAKIEITPQGINRRFLVTNMSGHPQGIYRGFYVQRGEVPESPIGECKKGLQADRLSSHRFRANGMKFMIHTLAYALVVLYREASAVVKEMAKAEVSTWRTRLWKVGAVVVTSARRIWFHLSSSWPYRELWVRVHEAAMSYVQQLRRESS
jgi:Transposase DDE domain group 1